MDAVARLTYICADLHNFPSCGHSFMLPWPQLTVSVQLALWLRKKAKTTNSCTVCMCVCVRELRERGRGRGRGGGGGQASGTPVQARVSVLSPVPRRHVLMTAVGPLS